MAHGPQPALGNAGSSLDRLIEVEDEIQKRAGEVRSEVAAILASARAEAGEAALRMELQLTADATQMADDLRTQLRKDLELLEHERERRIAVLQEVSGDRLALLVQRVVERVIGADAEEIPP
jgi:hypothetical protein